MSKKFSISRSQEIYERARNIIPGGSQTFSKGPTQFVNGFMPMYMDHAKGAYTWDVDGNKFLDYIMACHPIILGHADDDVNKAIIKQLAKGTTFSLMNELEVDVAELLVKYVPCAEAVRFGKNGADATTIGVKIARAVTGREKIAYCGYHGWHDWFIANTDLNKGIPEFNKKLAHSFQYNNLDSLQKIFEENPGEVAIVIMEPLTVLEPLNNFLHEVKKMAHHYGALLMFDEIITGFRFAIGGAQELTGVTPDLATFAKAISNGVPLSAITGKKEYMEGLGKDIFFSFTYGGDCIGLSAAKVAIPKIVECDVPKHLTKVGTILKDGINNLAKQYDVYDYIKCLGYPCRTVVALEGMGKFEALELKSYFQQEMARGGVLWAAYHALSYSHSVEDMHYTLNVFEDAIKGFKKVLDNGQSLLSKIEGEPVKPVFRKVTDFNSFTVKDAQKART